MADIKEFVSGFMGVIIGLTVAVTLLPVISGAIASANVTGTSAMLIGIVPSLVAVGILLFAVKSLF